MKSSNLPSHRLPLIAPLLAVLTALITLLTASSAGAVEITNIFNTVGTNNWVCPPGVTSIKVECWGGGGAGGGSFVTTAGTANAGGGGGGGGAYAKLNTVSVTPGASYTIAIPAAATCPASGFTNLQRYNGSAVSFTGNGGTNVTANGGTGGQSAIVTGGTAFSGAIGVGGAAGSGFDAAWAGGSSVFWSSGNGAGGGGGAGDLGAGGSPSAANATFGAGGTGSDTVHTGGDGGLSRNGAGTGNSGAAPGGGGGGAKSTSTSKTSRAGGTGGLGQIIITYTEVPNFKADNTLDLTNSSSWTVGVPTASGVAIWNNLVTSPNTTSLGADLSFGGITILDPGGPVTINPGNTLTNADAGIDMTAATQDLTILADYVPLTAVHNLKVAAGRTLTLSNVLGNINTTGNLSGPGTLRVVGTTGALRQLTNSATLVIDGGTVANNGSPLTTGPAAGDTVTTIITNGGSLNLNTANGSSINFGFQNTGTSVFTVDSGSVYVTNSGSTSANALTLANVAGATAIMNLNGGTVTLAPKTLTDGVSGETTLRIANNATATGVLNLNGGTLNVPYVLGVGTCTVNFNGTTVVGNKDNTTWFSGPITANVQVGGAIFNSSGYSQTIPQALLHDAGLGATPDGGLTKLGAGTLTLTGPNTYTGPTLVSAGKLVVSSTSLATGPVTNNAALGITASGVSQWAPASLTLANPSTLEFNSVQNPGTTTAPILPTAAVGAVANVTINVNSISGVVTPTNSYPLLGNAGTTNGYVLGSQPLGVTGHLEISTLDSSTLVYVVDSSADLWTGADFTNPTWWDIAITPNWDGKAQLNTPFGTFADGDGVLFDDSAVPASPVTVDIQTAVSPGNMIFANSAKDYILTNSSGTAGIGGTGGLTKTGSGTLTLASSNSYSGGTINSGASGIVVVNHANALGTGPFTFAGGRRLSVETGLEVTNAIIIGANSGNAGFGLLEAGATPGTATVSGPIQINNGPTGGGHFAARTAGTVLDVKGVITASVPVTQRIGPGTVKFSGGGTGYTNLTVGQDTVMVGAADGISTAATVSIANSGTATLDLNGFNQSLAGIVKGANSATITNSSATPVTLRLTGTSSYGGTIKDDGGTGKIALTVAGGDLTLSGANTHSGDTLVNAGTLMVSNNLALQNSALITTGAGTLTLGTGITAPTIGGLSGASGDLATIITSGYGNVTALTLNPLSGTVTYGGVIADGAAGMTLTKSGAGTQVLNGASTFTGDLTVSAGTLQMGGDNRLSTSSGLDLAENGTTSAILDLNGYDQTLSRLGFSATNAAGNLTIIGGANSTLTINATTDTQLGAGGTINAIRDVTTDLSGLGEFVWSGATNTFRVGLRTGVGNTANPGTATVTLADQNTILAATLAIGTLGANNHGGTNVLHLGRTNVLNVDSIQVGTSGRSFGTLDFATGLTDPKVTIRGTNAPNDATARVTSWDVGRVVHFGNSTWTATNDFSAGLLDARATSLRLGRADALNQTGRAGTENAGFLMGKGTLDVTTLVIGQYAGVAGSGISASGNFAGNGTFDLNDAAGLVTAEDIILADNIGLATNGVTRTTSGTFNLDAGTIEAKTIDKGADTGNATSTTRAFNFTDGTVRNYPGFGLTIANVPVNFTGSGTRNFEATSGQTIAVASVISDSGGGQGFIKTGLGTLTLSGANTYTGSTVINAGTLLVTSPGSIDPGSAVTVNAGGTLGGDGTVGGSVTVADGGNLAPGTLTIGTLTCGSSTLQSGSTLLMELDKSNAATNDVLAGSVFAGGTLTVTNIGPGLQVGDTFTLFSPGSVFNTFAATNLPAGYTWTVDLGGQGTIEVLTVTTPPAPTPTNVTIKAVSGELVLEWPNGQGWVLQSQSNPLSVGLSTNWVDVATASPYTNAAPAAPAQFYRLIYTNAP